MCVVCLTDISVPEPYMRANQIPCLASFAPLGAAIALPLELPLALGRIRMGRSNALPPGSTVADVLGLVRGAVKKRRGCGKSLTPAETFEVGSLWVRGTAWGPARASRGSAAGADGLRRAVAEQRPYTRSPTRPAGGRSDRATRCPSNDPIRGRRAGRVAAGVLRGGRRGGQSGGLRNADSEQRPYRWRPTRLAAGRLDRAARCPSNDPIRGRRPGRVAAGVQRGGRRGGQSGGLRNADSEQQPYTRSPTRPAGGRSDRATRCPGNDPIRGPAAGRIAAESCVTADLVGRAVDCGMRTPSNDPIRGRWTGRIAAESCVAADLVGKAGLRNGDAEQRPYTRPAGRGMSRR